MGMFIEVRVNLADCQAPTGCKLCTQVCPVGVFRLGSGQVNTAYDNEDECTLCDLCVDQCPGNCIVVNKLYWAASTSNPFQ